MKILINKDYVDFEAPKYISDSQKTILEALYKGSFENVTELAAKVDLSTAMLYRTIDELKDMDLVITNDGIKLTDAGKIERL